MTTSAQGTHLSSVQVDAIRDELAEQLTWRKRQLADLESTVEDGTVADTAKAAILADIVSAERNIALVRQTLSDIEGGTYGRCDDCRTPIPFERLKIRPLARYCMTCQRRHEVR
jgi:DnaK suppressor protein